VPCVTALIPLGNAVLDTAAAWLAAVALAVLVGFVVGLAPRAVQDVTLAVVGVLRPLPAVTLAPIVLVLHGSTIVVGCFAALWPVLWHTLLRAPPDPTRMDVVAVYRVSRWRAFWWVRVPSAVPGVMNGLRIGAPVALAAVLGTELLAGNGLGGYLWTTAHAGQVALVSDAVAATGLLGWIVDAPLDTSGHAVPVLDGIFGRLRWLVFALFLLFWQGVTWFAHDRFFPAPLAILARARGWWSVDLLLSVGRLAAGWGIAAVVGIGLGLLLAGHAGVVLSFLLAVPPVVLVPVFLTVSRGDVAEIAAIAAGGIWPILVHTAHGVRTVDPVTIQTARVFRVRLPLVRVVVRAAAPRIFAGLRIGLATSITVSLLMELLGTGGIGHRLALAWSAGDFTAMWAWLVLVWVISAAAHWLLVLVGRRVS
jgi:ABC-type nitrate/sulfonate/bicarbonate transport system permease component